MQVLEFLLQPVFLHEIGQIHQPVGTDIRLDFSAPKQHEHVGRCPGHHLALQLLLTMDSLVHSLKIHLHVGMRLLKFGDDILNDI
ncbi:hypothetical protein D3C81_1540070 [compost metagenome]